MWGPSANIGNSVGIDGFSSQISSASTTPFGVASYVSTHDVSKGSFGSVNMANLQSSSINPSSIGRHISPNFPIDRLQVAADVQTSLGAVGTNASSVNPFGIASYVSAPLVIDGLGNSTSRFPANLQKLTQQSGYGGDALSNLPHIYNIGDEVEIWSSSQKKWCTGRVDRVEGEFLSVMYLAPAGNKVCKVLRSCDKSIRIAGGTASSSKPAFSGNALLALEDKQNLLSKLPHIFKLGDSVEIWSNSQQNWCAGKIDRVEGHLVSVQYMAPDGQQICKVMDNGDQNIRHTGQHGRQSSPRLLQNASLAHVTTPTINDGPNAQLDKVQLHSGRQPGEAEITLVLDTFRSRDDFGNGECADCGSAKPEWASLKEGTLVCLDCAGVHRCLSLPMKSMARTEIWSASEVLQFCGMGGNVEANKRLAELAALEAPRPPPDMDRDFIERFIVRKHNGTTFFHHDECAAASRALVRELAQEIEQRRLAKEKAEREAREAAERKRREQAEKAARDLAIWEAKKAAREKAEQEAREAAERARREQADRIVRELAARDAEAERIRREQSEMMVRAAVIAQVPPAQNGSIPPIGAIPLSPSMLSFKGSAGPGAGLIVVDVVAVNLFKERVADLRYMGSWFLNLTVVLSLGKISSLSTSPRKGAASVRWEPPEQRELRWDCKQRWLWCRVNDNVAGGATQLAGVGVVDVRAAQREAHENGTGIKAAEMELELLAKEPQPQAGLGDLIFLDACQVKPPIMVDDDLEELDTDPTSRKANAACWQVSVGRHGPPGPPGGHGHYMFEQVEDLDNLTNGHTCGTVILRISVHDPLSQM